MAPRTSPTRRANGREIGVLRSTVGFMTVNTVVNSADCQRIVWLFTVAAVTISLVRPRNPQTDTGRT